MNLVSRFSRVIGGDQEKARDEDVAQGMQRFSHQCHDSGDKVTRQFHSKNENLGAQSNFQVADIF